MPSQASTTSNSPFDKMRPTVRPKGEQGAPVYRLAPPASGDTMMQFFHSGIFSLIHCSTAGSAYRLSTAISKKPWRTRATSKPGLEFNNAGLRDPHHFLCCYIISCRVPSSGKLNGLSVLAILINSSSCHHHLVVVKTICGVKRRHIMKKKHFSLDLVVLGPHTCFFE